MAFAVNGTAILLRKTSRNSKTCEFPQKGYFRIAKAMVINMKEYVVAVLGATGAVGREMLRVLEERNFPLKELRPLASARRVGQSVRFGGEAVPIRQAEEAAFLGADLVLGAVDAPLARRFAPAIRQAGAVFIDNSSAFRLEDHVPLVVPEINGGDAFLHRGVIANPNCSTIIALMAVAPIARLSPIQTLVASTYQAVSGAGSDGLAELKEQTLQWAAGQEGAEPPMEMPHRAFAHQIAFNVLPRIGGVERNGYTAEEMKLQNEGRKILHQPEMKVSCTCVRVPVLRSHSISATVVTKERLSLEKVRAALCAFPGLRLEDEPEEDVYPMPLFVSGKDEVLVGRLRRDLISQRGLSLWCCGDQLRKGAATNAVEIAELIS